MEDELILQEIISNNKKEIIEHQNLIKKLEFDNKKRFEELGKIAYKKSQSYEDYTQHTEIKFLYFADKKKLIYSGSIFKDTANGKYNQNIRNKLDTKKRGNLKTRFSTKEKVWKIENIEKDQVQTAINIIKEELKNYIDNLEVTNAK